MIVTGLPSTGMPEQPRQDLAMLSWTEMPPNMKAKRKSAVSTSRRLFSQR